MPIPRFNGWTPWAQRSLLEERHLPALYLLGRFEGGPPDRVDPLSESVIFIGETHAQALADRLGQFEYCAFQGGTGHSPGITFAEKFPGLNHAPAWLFIAVHGLSAESATDGDDMKRQLLSEYKERHKRLPACNKRAH